ncbi:MAG: response regulator [Candidatus Sumerlaeia bacterium]|nr:response regulator [Candidatus Sumerlaeia bacterium]
MIPTETKFALLLVEDNPADADLVQELLELAGGESYRVILATRVAQALEQLSRNQIDAVLLDLRLPDASGVETVRSVQTAAEEIPIIVLTGTDDEQLAISCIDAGAQDYLHKGDIQPAVLRRAIGYSITRSREAKVRQQQVQQLISSSPDAVVVTDTEGVVRYANEAAIKLFGKQREAFVGDRFNFDVSTGQVLDIEILRQGSRRTAEMRVVDVEWHGDPAYMASIRDTTDKRLLEDRIRQSQKMEAIGRLAGGVAHDFNNLLTVIMGSVDLLSEELPPEDSRRQYVEEISRSSEHAAALTRQLLAFSRRSVTNPEALDLGVVVGDVERMLRRIIGEHIELVTQYEPGLGTVLADPMQIGQVVMNLAINARDAMPAGGTLTIRTGNVHLGVAEADAYDDAAPGDYVCLEVSDTGTGMDDETRARLFEPFFTTKPRGKGTGLGLATVYGIVKQANGSVTVQTALGRGTTFSIFLPVHRDVPARPVATTEPRKHRAGEEIVLLVEDDQSVRDIATLLLLKMGYTVLAASGGEEALALVRDHPKHIDILLTDIVMPGMNGYDVARSVRALLPGLPIVFMSGYTEDAIQTPDVEEGGIRFVEKPVSRDALARVIREAIEEAESP